MVRKIKYVIYVLLSLMIPDLTAQVLPFDYYTIREGLPSNWITRIYQDSSGYIWLASDEGITKYDGAAFENYGLTDGLPVSHVWAITESKKHPGMMWVGTHGGGLCKFFSSPKDRQERFQQIILGRGISVNIVSAIIEDKKGNVWCGTNDGIAVIRNDSVTFPPEIERKPVEFLKRDDHFMWAGMGENIYKISLDSNHIKKFTFPIPEGVYFSAFIKDNDDYIWLSTTQGKIFLIREEKDSLKSIQSISFKPFPMDMAADANKNLWVSTTNDGIYTLSRDGNNIRAINYSVANGLSDERISCCFVDKENNIWIGNYSKGLTKLAYNNILFFNYKDFPVKIIYPSAVSHKNGHLFFTSEEGLTEIWELPSGEWKKEFHRLDKGAVRGDVFKVFSDSQGNIVAAFFGGVCIYKVTSVQNRKSELRLIRSLALGKEMPEGRFNSVSLHEGTNDEYYLCCWIDGNLVLYDLKSNIKKIITPEDGLPGDDCRFAWQDTRGNFWFGDFNNGLTLFEKSGNDLRPRKKFTVNDGLPDNSIRAIFQRSNGEMWIGTRFGGIAVIKDEKIIRKISVRDGLLSNAVWDFNEDSENRLWIATSLGINISEPGSSVLTSVNRLKSYFAGSIGILPDNSVWAVGRNELIIHKYKKEDSPSLPPPVKIAGLRVNGKDVDIIPGLDFSYDENYIVVMFRGLSFKDEKNILYKYRILGLDSVWSEPSENRFVTYGSLKPGNYTFEVVAINSDSVQSSVPASLSFNVSPPIWQRWWFIGLSLLLIFGIIAGLVQLRINRLLKIERIRSGIATDLHDDIGSGLTHIGLLSEVLIRKHKSHSGTKKSPDLQDDGTGNQLIQDDYLKSVEQIGKISRELSSAMNDVVWSINPRYDSMDALIKRTSSFAHELCKTKNIRLNFTHSEDLNKIKMNPEVRRNLLLIMKEAVNNSVKYSQTSVIDIKIEQLNNTLDISVKDSGTGFDTGLTAKGNGLANIQSRAKKINGNCIIESKKGEGTLIKITLDLP